MYLLVVIVPEAAIARGRAIASFCDCDCLVNDLTETEPILCHQSPDMTGTACNGIVQNNGIDQFVVIYDLVETALNIISLDITVQQIVQPHQAYTSQEAFTLVRNLQVVDIYRNSLFVHLITRILLWEMREMSKGISL